MEKEKIALEAAVNVGRVTLVPVVRIRLGSARSKSGFSVSAHKEPVGVVVLSPQARKAFQISGAEMPLDELAAEVAGLKQMLEEV